ncbi:glycoside hydrolase superfamily [Chytriomyces sp. MP71]|nr:glycoside hydrolase superfamily [Chytriomyces sp. MP71]
MRSLAILTASLTTLSGASALSKLEPPNGKILFGVWFDGTGNTSSYSGGDTASAVNSRLGFNVGSFQVWQELPLKPPASGIAPLLLPSGEVNMDMFDEKTDASIFLTVYPDLSATITDDHIKALGTQCAAIIKGGRNVFIRLGPEMNGEWMQYGNKPTQFVALWKRVYTILNETAPQVAMVWSPNYNGVNGQNPFDPYWPGPEFVDWIGISLYWKGFAVDWPWGVNKLAPSSYTAGVLTGTGGESAAGVSIYDQFAVKYGKPLVISETGAGFVFGAFNPSTQVVAPVAPGPGRKDLQMESSTRTSSRNSPCSKWSSVLNATSARTILTAIFV